MGDGHPWQFVEAGQSKQLHDAVLMIGIGVAKAMLGIVIKDTGDTDTRETPWGCFRRLIFEMKFGIAGWLSVTSMKSGTISCSMNASTHRLW